MTSTYELTEQERKTAQNLMNAVLAAKIGVYDANVQLDGIRTKVNAAVREVELAEARFSACVATTANAHGITSGRISPDLTRIEENQ